MDINVAIYRKDNNKQIARSVVIRIDLEENEVISIDDDFQKRWAGNVKDLVNCEIEDTKDLGS